MSRSVNKAIVLGHLGQDPDVRFTANGNAIANLSIATDESYKDKQSGQMVPRTEWHKVSVFGKLAEIVGQYLHKGSKVYVEGRLTTRKWQAQDGQDRYTTEIVVDIKGQILMLDEKPKGQAQAAQQSQQAPQQPQRTPQQQAVDAQRPAQAPVDEFDQDNIPF